MLLSAPRLISIIHDGTLTNTHIPLNEKLSDVNAASIDIRLGETILFEEASHGMQKVSLRKKQSLGMRKHSLLETPYLLYPGDFILAQSQEIFRLPNNLSAEYKLKSSMARIGLEHLNAGWCDAGWNGSVLTLELQNVTRNHVIELSFGDKIGQMVFFRHEEVPPSHSYATKGRYNQDTTVQGAKA